MRIPTWTLVAVAFALPGCFGTTQPSRFYLLSATPPGPKSLPSPGPEAALGVFPTRVAAYLDRPQMVTFQGDNGVALDEYNRWAEPLGAGITRVLAQELATLLPAWRVVPQPWDPTIPLRARLVVDVTTLGWSQAGEVRLEANWVVLESKGEFPIARGRSVLRREAAARGTDAAVATASALVGEMAREIAAAVKAIPAS
jgi:uncharacterized lipoprotein YmbA